MGLAGVGRAEHGLDRGCRNSCAHVRTCAARRRLASLGARLQRTVDRLAGIEWPRIYGYAAALTFNRARPCRHGERRIGALNLTFNGLLKAQIVQAVAKATISDAAAQGGAAGACCMRDAAVADPSRGTPGSPARAHWHRPIAAAQRCAERALDRAARASSTCARPRRRTSASRRWLRGAGDAARPAAASRSLSGPTSRRSKPRRRCASTPARATNSAAR